MLKPSKSASALRQWRIAELRAKGQDLGIDEPELASEGLGLLFNWVGDERERLEERQKE